MRFPVLRFFVFAVVFLAAAALHATTYYVATNGNNSNACTSATAPCLTITGAVGKSKAGDIVQVAAGSYKENPSFNKAGASGSPIIVRGHDGSGCPTTTVSDPNSPTGTRPNSKVLVTGWISVSSSYVTIDCLHLLGGGIWINSGLTGGQVLNNEIDGNGSSTPGAGMGFNGIASVSYTNFSTNFLFKGNYIHGMSGGFFGMCSSCTISENEIYALTGDEPGSDHDYIDFWGVGSTISHNYMHGNTSNACMGYDCHMDCLQAWNTTGNGTEVSKNNTFTRNICYNHHEGVIMQDNAGNGDIASWTVTNNVFGYGPIDDGSGHPAVAGSAHPWCWVFEDGKMGSNTFSNNTCITGSMGFRANSGSAVFNDNIYYTSGSTTTIYDTSGASVTGANNLYYAASGTFKATYSGDIVNKNPNFVTTGTGGTTQCTGCNYNLQSSSPAINAGISTAPAVTVDLIGTARPQGSAYDIGAYEYTSSTSTQPAAPKNLTGVVK